MEGNVMLLIAVCLPLFCSVLIYAAGKKSRAFMDMCAIAVAAVELVILAAVEFYAVNGKPLSFLLDGFCGRELYFNAAGFQSLFAFIAGIMWLATTIFSKEYLAHYKNVGRYYLFVFITLGATVGVFLSGDLFTTFICFEIVSFASYAWVAHDENKAALRAADTYLGVAVIGGLVLLMGLMMLYTEIGTLRISEIHAAYESAKAVSTDAGFMNRIYISGALMLFGFGAKAGAVPLHIWLPKAHPVAPAPASALLSGILTKTGVFGVLFVTCQIFAENAAWGNAILLTGVLTMVGGAVLAVFSVNFKRTLACSSMSQIGFIFVGIGMQCLLAEENAMAVNGTFLHMVNHSMLKLVLFMVAGVIYMNTHKLDLNEIRGFGRGKIALNIAYLLGFLGIGGIPLFNGYVSKTLIHESIVEYCELIGNSSMAGFYTVVEWLFLFAGGLTLCYMFKLYVAVFWEKNVDADVQKSFNRKYMSAASAVTILVCAVLLPVIGFVAAYGPADVVSGALQFGIYEPHAVHIELFAFENLKGAIISIVVGAVVYFGIVRTLLMKRDENGNKVYVDRWPEWLDIENLVYRPVIMEFLPFVCAFFSRIADKLLDTVVLAVRKIIFRPLNEKSAESEKFRGIFNLGYELDRLIDTLNRTLLKKRPIRKSAVNGFMIARTTSRETNKIILRSVSFSLLLFCLGLGITLLYLLL